jgi:hypothetical protein
MSVTDWVASRTWLSRLAARSIPASCTIANGVQA